MIERSNKNIQAQKVLDWREYLSIMDNQQFFSLMHLYIGEVKTPYNKQNLIEQLSSFIRKEENQNLIFNLLSENDILILSAIHFIPNITQEKLSSFFSGTFNFATLYEILLNLEERLLIFKKFDADHKTNYYKINPLLEKKLLSILNISNLLQTPETKDSSTIIENTNKFQLTPLFLASIYSLINLNPDLCKLDGTFKKKIENSICNIFPSIADSKFLIQIITSLKNLSLVIQNDNYLEINHERWKSFSNLTFTEQYIYLAISHNAKLTQNDLQKKAILLSTIIDNISESGFTKNTLYKCAYLINEKLSNDNFSFTTSSRLSSILNRETNQTSKSFTDDISSIINDAINFGILIHFSQDINNEPIYKVSKNFCDLQTSFNSEKVLTIDSGFNASILPEINLSSVLEIINFMELKRFDTILQMEITKKSCIKSFDLKETPETICAKLEKYCNHEIPQNLKVSIEDWYENYLSAQIYHGYVLKVSEAKKILIENNPEIAPHIKTILAPGIYLLDFTDSEQAQNVIEKSQLDFIGNVRNTQNQISLLPFQKFSCVKNLFELIQNQENPNLQIKNELIQELKNHLSTMELTKEQYEDLLNRINRKIVITKTQLRKETVKVEKIEAFGMDFSGKIHVIENAISSKSFIEISYEANNLPEGKQVILGTPISLSKDINDTYVEILVEPEKTQKTLSLASALSVKKIRGAILNG